MINSFIYKKGGMSEYDLNLLKDESIIKKKKQKLWISLINPSKEEIILIQEKFNLHSTTLEDLDYNTTRIKYEEFDNNIFLVLRGIKKISNENNIEFYSFFIIDGDNYLITIFHEENKVINSLLNNHKRIESLLKNGEDYILHYIIDKEIDKYVYVKTKISEYLQEIEGKFIEKPNKQTLKDLFLLEKMIIEFKQKTDATTDICQFLQKPSYNFIQKKLLPYFRDVYDHSLKVNLSLKTYLERINSLRHSYHSLLSIKMDETIRILTIIMAFMMPMTIITGFYGMNVTLPIQNNKIAYVIITLIMVGIIGFMFFFFKRKGWLSNDNINFED
jgi:magnesium transporter